MILRRARRVSLRIYFKVMEYNKRFCDFSVLVIISLPLSFILCVHL